MKIIQNNLNIVPKTLACFIWDRIKNGKELNEREYKYWLIGKFELIENGCILYYSDGKEYWKNGKIHRDNGPAVIYPDGHKEYWKNGLRHNDNGPAIICSNGTKAYWKNGKAIGHTAFFADKTNQSQLLRGLAPELAPSP